MPYPMTGTPTRRRRAPGGRVAATPATTPARSAAADRSAAPGCAYRAAAPALARPGSRILLVVEGGIVWLRTIQVGAIGLTAEAVPQPSSRQGHQHRGRGHRDREQHLAVGVR